MQIIILKYYPYIIIYIYIYIYLYIYIFILIYIMYTMIKSINIKNCWVFSIAVIGLIVTDFSTLPSEYDVYFIIKELLG
jgi:hypothetical protein